MNPVLAPAQFEDFLIRAGTKNVPHFSSGDPIKLSAAWLIEHAGFHKGFVHSNVGLSSKHTLAVINRGGAAREVIELVTMTKDGGARHGVELQPEPNFIGLLTTSRNAVRNREAGVSRHARGSHRRKHRRRCACFFDLGRPR